MAGHAAIADVGLTLVELLRDRMGSSITDEEIVLASPGAEGAGDDFRLTLYLYDVSRNEHLSNEHRPPDDPTERPGNSLALDLHYLLTAHAKDGSSDPPTTKTTEQHTVLGRAMQVFQDNAIVRTPELSGDLTAGDEVTVSVEPVSREDVVNIWTTFSDDPYEPSIPYVVSPVIIESERTVPVDRVLDAEFSAFTFRTTGGDDEP
ncbi:DUF4255 domain-containing protein [Halopenitus sp. H-Gu1]|uniref:DUF4255 domain-containing protein n=1 Tax=Halopenitus sp. H-Gu1 TaxID=3242697 RepID=UPI00359D3FC0